MANQAPTSEPERWKDVDIPARYRGWSLDQYPETVQRQVRDWLNDKESWSLYIRGELGTRKSSLAAAILRLWRSHFPPGRDGLSAGWFLSMRSAARLFRDFEKKDNTLDQCENTRLLVLDDLGATRSTAHIIEQLGFVLADRYENFRKTIITTNLTLKDFAANVDKRLADRLKEGASLKSGEESKR